MLYFNDTQGNICYIKLSKNKYMSYLFWSPAAVLGGISSSVLSVFFTDKFYKLLTMNPGLKNVSICSQQENCQISLKIVSIRSQISS